MLQIALSTRSSFLLNSSPTHILPPIPPPPPPVIYWRMTCSPIVHMSHFVFRSESLGLIPQSLSLIFQKIQHNQDEAVSLHLSFLEIYKEMAYDLLGPLLFRGSRKIKELPKVRAVIVFLISLSAKHFTLSQVSQTMIFSYVYVLFSFSKPSENYLIDSSALKTSFKEMLKWCKNVHVCFFTRLKLKFVIKRA